LLYKVIGGNDAPFVYEKSGSVYKHFMIDEFQDTSTLQWNNFNPLIANSLSSGHFSMVVGDVKQSIYRWRNSDWKLLADKIEHEFDVFGTQTSTLDTNWRSSENVIGFNNKLFELAAELLQNTFNEKLQNIGEEQREQWQTKILKAYGDAAQKVSSKAIGSGGFINMVFLEDDKETMPYDEKAVQVTLDMIKEILGQGYTYKDICVLVRKTSEANIITNALLSGDYLGEALPVVSNEALMLSGSVAVNMLVNQLSYILNPENDIYKAYILLYSKELQAQDISSTIDANLLDANHNECDQLLTFKGMPLIDLVETLVRRLPQSRLDKESVFLQAFIDVATDFVKNESADLAGFLKWWVDEGQFKSVSVPEEQDAIRVMTVHKSKGLEFEHVLMPFLDWDLDSTRHSSILWCKDPIGSLEYVPIRYDKKMIDSHFAPYYFDELLHQYVDNLNILYVSFTRAKKSLQGILPIPSSASKNTKTAAEKMSNISHLILTLLEMQTSQFGPNTNLTEKGFTLGQLGKKVGKSGDSAMPAKPTKTGEFTTIELPKMMSWDYASRVRIFMESENFTDSHSPSQVSQGKIMHRLFESIKTADDVDIAIQRLVIEGLINEDKAASTSLHIKNLLSQTHIAEWFTPSSKIYNETSVLFNSTIHRPDRVVIQGNKAIVIDYKFGETHSATHLKQVKQYMGLIKDMGYTSIDGFVWYVTENTVVNVPFDGQHTLF
jgi:ATP-dependent helicase/nuclease subunit A